MNVPQEFNESVRVATKDDAAYIAQHLRYGDLDEILVGRDITPRAILKEALETSKECFVYVVDGKPVSIFGCAPTDHGAVIWMLGTDRLDTMGTTILRVGTWFVRDALERYGFLYNWVDMRNTKSIRFLKWLGFRFNEPVDNHGHSFAPFWMNKAILEQEAVDVHT